MEKVTDLAGLCSEAFWRSPTGGAEALAVMWARNCKALSQQIERNCNRKVLGGIWIRKGKSRLLEVSFLQHSVV